MFYLPTPGLFENQFANGAHTQYQHFLDGQHVNHQTLPMCWLQFGINLNCFQRKTGTGFHKSVKHCKRHGCWEAEQVPHD